MRVQPSTSFKVPSELSATVPPEARGLARDGVRLLVARERHGVDLWHARFTDLPVALRRGDLVVVNTSATMPAAVDGHRRGGDRVTLHVSGPAHSDTKRLRRGPFGATPPAQDDSPDASIVELRSPDGTRITDAVAGETVALPRQATATLLTAHPDPERSTGSRLWVARIDADRDLPAWLAAVGRPIRYAYVRKHWPLSDYQTIFASPGADFGSAEMPSAGRPFSPIVVAGLQASGIGLAEIELHTGVSSLEADELPLPERFRVPAATADAVNATRAAGGRIIAVGTTVTRALETVAAPNGVVQAGSGWTNLVLGPDRPARVVNGLITGWHEPEASHLLLLEAVAGPALVGAAYTAALGAGYLWHEFGDSCLLLPAHNLERSDDCAE